MRLSTTRVKALRAPGRYSDGDGLHPFINKSGRKSWVQRITIDGRRRDVGLGVSDRIAGADEEARNGQPREDWERANHRRMDSS